MKARKVQFTNTIQPDFVITLRKRVKDYFEENGISQYGNSGMVFKTIFMFSLYFVPYALMISGLVATQLGIMMMWVTMGFGMAGIGLSIMHDANHKSYSKRGSINNILSLTLNLVGGYNRNWQYQHNTMHHSYTNIDGFDEDINPVGILRFSPNKPLLKVHRFQKFYAWFFYGLMTLTWSIDKDFRQLIRYKKEGVSLSQRNSFGLHLTEMIVSKVIFYTYILVIPILLLPIPWWNVVLYYLLMQFICGFILGIIFQTAHVMPTSAYPLPDKNGTIENNWAIHQMATTSDYSPRSTFFSWFIGGLNYQVVHHLFPNICHVHYRNLAPIVKETAREYNLPYYVQPNFASALKNHYVMLKQLGME